MDGKSTTQTSPTEVRNSTWPRRDLRSPDSIVDSSWNVMAHGDARRGIEGGKCRMQCVASTLRTTSEHAHYCHWRPHLGCQQSTVLTTTGRIKWTRPFDCKDEIWFSFACAITFQTESRDKKGYAFCTGPFGIAYSSIRYLELEF